MKNFHFTIIAAVNTFIINPLLYLGLSAIMKMDAIKELAGAKIIGDLIGHVYFIGSLGFAFHLIKNHQSRS